MNNVLRMISDRIEFANQDKAVFPDVLFGPHMASVHDGIPVVLFGAGIVGAELCRSLRNRGIEIACFGDNDPGKTGSTVRGVPVVSLEELRRNHKESLIVIATRTYASEIKDQLLENGFHWDRIICNEFSIGLTVFIRDGSQDVVESLRLSGPEALFNKLLQDQQKVEEAYHLLNDKKSKDLFIARLAHLVGYDNLNLLDAYMRDFSEPFIQFGLTPVDHIDENYYYFNNDVYDLSNDEVLVDVGAYDGDTIDAFLKTCAQKGIKYSRIYSFEPDPRNFRVLAEKACKHENIDCHRIGLWSQPGIFRFKTSQQASIMSSSAISNEGDLDISVVTLDEFLNGNKVTMIKMDPAGGNTVMEAVKGAAGIIKRDKPKLVLGAYNYFEAIYEMPLQLYRICPDYKLFLRHISCGINETDLFAVV